MLVGIRRAFSVLRDVYLETVRSKNMKVDEQQLEVIQCLEHLKYDIETTHLLWKRSIDTEQFQPAQTPRAQQKEDKRGKGNFFSGLFKRQFSTANSAGLEVKGIYLYGGSGCGKSFLSDIFFNNLAIKEKQRLHFHEFMGGIHAELFELERGKRGFDPLVSVAASRAKTQRLLYLDQFQVTDVADASILKRLFEQLLKRGMILLATSNRHPTDLYKGGHQRQFFLPFIDLIQEKCKIIQLKSHDYRLAMERSHDSTETTYIYPNTPENQARFMRVLSLVAGVPEPVQFSKVILEPVTGRELTVHRACHRVCFYDFEELMEAVMGDVDFRSICKNFRAVFIRNLRKINSQQRNLSNRLIKLFDEAYFRGVKIYILGAVGLENVIQVPENPRNEEEFALIRCHSRLIEFQTKIYKERLSYCEKPEIMEYDVEEDESQKDE